MVISRLHVGQHNYRRRPSILQLKTNAGKDGDIQNYSPHAELCLIAICQAF